MTTKLETAVRDAATTLHDAIKEAEAAGLQVHLPRTVDGLPGIAISETAVTHPTVTVSGAVPVVAEKATKAAQRVVDKA